MERVKEFFENTSYNRAKLADKVYTMYGVKNTKNKTEVTNGKDKRIF